LIPWITYEEAITEGLRVEMRRDPTVVCMSSEGSLNGTPRPTDELLREFGPGRIHEPCPLESMLSAAVAAESEGLRPVCEVELTELVDEMQVHLEAIDSTPLALRVVWGLQPTTR
jgi:pyruvate/2-oxoglutarate/acetoin dehydrogenase E1 component